MEVSIISFNYIILCFYFITQLEVYTTSNRHLGKIQVASEATVKDIKIAVAKLNKKLSIERQSLRLDLRDKDRKDSATVASLGVANGGKIYIKDLGPQISWRTVFILEYLGPLVLYVIVATRPWIFYGDKAGSAVAFTTTARWLRSFLLSIYRIIEDNNYF